LGPQRVIGNGSRRKPIPRRPPSLSSTESTSAREKLIAELGQLPSGETLTDWALKRMTIKNSLTSSDAQLVEQAFQDRLHATTELKPADAAPPDVHRPSKPS